jgi:cardiolipin synthase
MVMVTDPGFAGKMEAMMREDFARSIRVDFAEFDERPWWFKTAVRLARLLSPVQ